MNKKGLDLVQIIVLLVGFVGMVWGRGEVVFKLNERGKSLKTWQVF